MDHDASRAGCCLIPFVGPEKKKAFGQKKKGKCGFVNLAFPHLARKLTNMSKMWISTGLREILQETSAF